MRYDIIVIGGGAAGIAAGISAARRGASVVICERLTRLGKKVMATGNGRCNLSNTNIRASDYNRDAGELAESVFLSFAGDLSCRNGLPRPEIEPGQAGNVNEAITGFFRRLGLYTYSDAGRVFPVTNQSSSVMKVLEAEASRLGIRIIPGFEAVEIKRLPPGFAVKPKSGEAIMALKAVIAGGGMSYPALGSDGSLYPLCAKLGHAIKEPVPSVVPLVVKDRMCHILQGQKIASVVRPVISGKPGQPVQGDLLFTKYGLSGTAVIDASQDISIAINRNKAEDVFLVVDMAPFADTEELFSEISKRVKGGAAGEDMIAGILPNKFALALEGLLRSKDTAAIVEGIKKKQFKVLGTRGWNEAEFTAGGVSVDEIRLGTLESKKVPGLYFAGEILDVNGRRGGYNLAWAWASGYVAGIEAAKSIQESAL